MDDWYAYFLRLGEGYFYVGISKDPTKRIEAHRNGEGSELTKKYGVKEVLGIWYIGWKAKESAELIEENITKCLMKKYGNKVRGGRMCSENKQYVRFGNETYLEKFQRII